MKAPNINFAELQKQLQAQFTGLHPSDPSRWPAAPRGSLLTGIFLLVAALLSGQLITDTLKQAINLDELKKQLEQVRQYVHQLEKQLPSKSEMDALLSDVNQAGLGRSLQFDLFRPGQVVVKDYYAELPISIKVTGSYHDIGQFTSDIAHLSRIVTLNNLTLTPFKQDKSSLLIMEGTAKTYRYLDPDEVAAQQKATKATKK